jgi:hypothetical protein
MLPERDPTLRPDDSRVAGNAWQALSGVVRTLPRWDELRASGGDRLGQLRTDAGQAIRQAVRQALSVVQQTAVVERLQSVSEAADESCTGLSKEHVVKAYGEVHDKTENRDVAMFEFKRGEHLTVETDDDSVSIDWTTNVTAESFVELATKLLQLDSRRGEAYVLGSGRTPEALAIQRVIGDAWKKVDGDGDVTLVRFDLVSRGGSGPLSASWSMFPDAQGRVRPHVGISASVVNSRLLTSLLEATASPAVRKSLPELLSRTDVLNAIAGRHRVGLAAT